MTKTTTHEKRPFTLLHKDGETPLVARIPADLTIGEAMTEIAGYAGYAREPGVSTRYALVAASPDGDGYGPFTLLRDDQRFTDVEEHSLLRVAPQPRPAGH